jgi:hypothetical protein
MLSAEQFPDPPVRVFPSAHATSRRASTQIGNMLLMQDVNGDGTIDFGIFSLTTGTTIFRLSTVGGATVKNLGTTVRTVTADFTVATTDATIINNKGSACVATLPAAASFTGREITITNIGGAFATTSNASNVVPRAGGAAGTAILPATDGAWADLKSDGTNWLIVRSS